MSEAHDELRVQRGPAPWQSWTIDQWTEYRDRQASACERFGEPWVTNVGRSLVVFAEAHIARLRQASAA